MAVLNADLVATAAADPAVVSAFPFLRSATKTGKRAGCCGKSGGGPSLDAIRASVVRLSPARRAEFKRMLGVDRLTVWTVKAAKLVAVEI